MRIVKLLWPLPLIFLQLFWWNLVFQSSLTAESELGFTPKPLPQVKAFAVLPSLTAESFLVMDVPSGTLVVSRRPYLPLAPASLTKLATALVAANSFAFEEVVSGRQYLVGHIMGIKEGELFRVKDLLLGLLVHSANDAAFSLAKNYPWGEQEFIAMMNQNIAKLGGRNTWFVNPDGEDDRYHQATAWDLAQLSRAFLQNQKLTSFTQLKEVTVQSLEGESSYTLRTTNELLGKYPGVLGLKTGWTDQAGECFIGYFQIGQRRIITVVLKSRDRFGDTVKLVDWVKQNVVWLDYSSVSAIHSTEMAGI